MPVQRYRSIEDMPPPWRDPDDPGNLRAAAQMIDLYHRLQGSKPNNSPRVQRFRSVQEMNAARDEPYHREDFRLRK